MELDLECVASFLALAQEEHFGRAAARLHLGSPALTKRIHRLERQVGTSLVVHRPTGGFELTAAGRQFLRQAERLLLQAQVTLAAAREHSGAPIRLGVPGRIGESPGREALKTLADLLRRNRPDIRVVCIPVPYTKVDEHLLHQRIDVAWTTSGCEHSGLESVPLTMMWRVGIVPARHEFADVVALDVAEFADQPILHNPDMPPKMMSPGTLGDYRPASEARLVPTRADQSDALLHDVARGLGVAAMPAALTPAILEAGLRPIALVGLMPVEIHAVRRYNDTRDAVIDLIHFLGFVANQASIPERAFGDPFARISDSSQSRV